MRKFLLAGAAALATLITTPALAQTNAGFTGPRLEVQVGKTAHDSGLTYGATAGADIAVSDRTTFGVDLTTTNTFDNSGRTLGAGARVGYAFNPNTLAYLRGGYSNLDAGHGHLDGFDAGAGLQLRIPNNFYISTEYRYSNYGHGVDNHAGLLGLGIRF